MRRILDLRTVGTVVGLLVAALGGPACYSSGGDDGDAGDARADDAGSDTGAPPFPTRFVLRLVSDIPETFYVAAWDPSVSEGHWLTLLDGGTVMAKADACDVCNCSDCPTCSTCGPPLCTIRELSAGTAGVEYLWDGRKWTTDGVCGDRPCEVPESVPAGTYAARFCWAIGHDETASCADALVGVSCADVEFTLPDPDGVVEYVIEHGG